MIGHHRSDIGDNDTSEIVLDLDILCKGIEGARSNPEGIKAAIKKILGLEVRKKYEDKRRKDRDAHKKRVDQLVAEMILQAPVKYPLNVTVVSRTPDGGTQAEDWSPCRIAEGSRLVCHPLVRQKRRSYPQRLKFLRISSMISSKKFTTIRIVLR